MYLYLSPRIPDGELPVYMNPGDAEPFGVIHLGDCEITPHTDEDCDRIIRAAARVKAMRAMLGTPHQFARSGGGAVSEGWCELCGMTRGWADHAEPEPEPSFGPDDVVRVTPAGVARLDEEAADLCQCGHEAGDCGITGRIRPGRIRPGCGCGGYRPRAAASVLVPPAVVTGEVVDEATARASLERTGGGMRLAVCGRHAAMDAYGRCDHCEEVAKPEAASVTA